MTRTHYHVNTFQPGCLNDASDGPYTNKRDAERAASELAQEYRDMEFYVTGNARRGGYWIQRTPDSIGGFRVVVEECEEADCFEEF